VWARVPMVNSRQQRGSTEKGANTPSPNHHWKEGAFGWASPQGWAGEMGGFSRGLKTGKGHNLNKRGRGTCRRGGN